MQQVILARGGRSEFRNLLGGYLRRKQLTFETVREIQREAEALLIGSEHEVDSQRVLEFIPPRARMVVASLDLVSLVQEHT